MRNPSSIKRVSVRQPVRLYAGQALEARVAQRRERFVEAGIRLFGTIGYQETTMRMLAAETGLTHRYFYESFETMEDLLVACYQQVIARYRARLVATIETTPRDLEGRIREGVVGFLTEMRDPHFARITQVEVIGVSRRVDALYVKTIREFGALIVGSMKSDGSVREGTDPHALDLIGVALAGAMSTAGALWMRSRYRDGIGTVADAMVTILLGTARELMRK